MQTSVGIRSLAVAFPRRVRTNDFWRTRHPDIVATASERNLARLLQGESTAELSHYDTALAPYLDDPFRGAIQRRVRSAGDTALSMEIEAAYGALSALGMRSRHIDLVLESSLVADQLGVGNAAYLARSLGTRAPSFTLESACASSVVGLHTAAGLVRAGLYRNVLVVVSASNTVQLDTRDTLSFFVGDGAAAFVVGPVGDVRGVLGSHSVNTAETCDMFRIHVEADPHTGWALRTHAHRHAHRIARDTAEHYLRTCVDGALSDAGLTLDAIDFFAFHSPTAFYPAFCARTLGVPEGRWINTYPRYANVGSVIMPLTLHTAARDGRLKRGDRVLAYAVGSSSSASAVVFEWGDVQLGPDPSPGEMEDDEHGCTANETTRLRALSALP